MKRIIGLLVALLCFVNVTCQPVFAAGKTDEAAETEVEYADEEQFISDLKQALEVRYYVSGLIEEADFDTEDLEQTDSYTEPFQAEYESICGYEKASFETEDLARLVGYYFNGLNCLRMSDYESEERLNTLQIVDGMLLYYSALDCLDQVYEIELNREDYRRIELTNEMVDDVFSLMGITDPASDEAENAEDTVEAPALSEDDIAFEELTVVDNDDCSITVTGVDINSSGCTVAVQFENKTDDVTLMYSVSSAAIEGIDIDPFFATEVAAGKKSNKKISFSSNSLADNRIESITDIEFTMRVSDSDDWNADAVAEETFHVYPYGEDKAQEYERQPEKLDLILAESDDASVTAIDCYVSDYGDLVLELYIENRTDTDIMCNVSNASVNGYMIDPYFSTEVGAGHVKYSIVKWYGHWLEENGISDVEEIEMRVKLQEYDWDGQKYCDEMVTIDAKSW